MVRKKCQVVQFEIKVVVCVEVTATWIATGSCLPYAYYQLVNAMWCICVSQTRNSSAFIN